MGHTQGEPPGSSPLRSDGSHGGQAGGWSGRAVAQRRPKTLKGRAGKQLWQPRDLTELGQKGSPQEKYYWTRNKEQY
jgi:hypothetical protein